MRRILALWLPNWPVQRVLADRPELVGRAVVLYEEDARYGNHVKACSPEAAELGVRPGMPLAEAKTLTPKRGQDSLSALSVFLHHAQHDQDMLLQLVNWCARFSPMVGLRQDQPDGLLMEVTGVTGLHGSESMLLERVTKAFGQRGLTVMAAVAETIAAAWAVARWGVMPTEGGSDLPPWKILPPGDDAELRGLPVAALRLQDRTMLQLQRLGIERLGQLISLPRSSLAARFGKLLLQRLDQIRGLAEEVIVVPPRLERLEVAWSFEYPTNHRKAISLVLEQLLRQLSERLTAQSRGVLQLQCRLLPQSRRPPRELTIGLYQPTTEATHLQTLVQMQLETLRFSEPIAEIQLIAKSTSMLEQRQKGLFADTANENSQKLTLLIERLSGRLGRDRVIGSELQPDAQPERAWRALPLTGARSRSRLAAAGKPKSPVLPWIRPLRLLDPPQAIEVMGISPGGPPAVFHYQQVMHRIARHFGPERIETGWWRGESCRRDYYRVETEAGQRLWLFRRLQDQSWFVHGEFD